MRLGSHSEREKNIILRTSMVSETPILLTLSMLLSVTGRSYKLQSQQARVKEITVVTGLQSYTEHIAHTNV